MSGIVSQNAARRRAVGDAREALAAQREREASLKSRLMQAVACDINPSASQSQSLADGALLCTIYRPVSRPPPPPVAASALQVSRKQPPFAQYAVSHMSSQPPTIITRMFSMGLGRPCIGRAH